MNRSSSCSTSCSASNASGSTRTRGGRHSSPTPKTQDAVIRNLEIVGQAVKDLGVEDLSRDSPDIPWAQIAGLRNVLSHQYLGVDLRLVWNVVESHVPALRVAVEAAIAKTRRNAD